VNVLKSHLRITIQTLLASGTSQHEIERRTGVDRKTIRRYVRLAATTANSPGVATGSSSADSATEIQLPPPRPPAPTAAPVAATTSACEVHRDWIEVQVQLGRNAQSIFQDLVESHGFTHHYNSVKRFVRALKAREPERFDVLEYQPAEEAQVDFGQGALTLHATGKYRRPWLFVMTLKYSGKSFRKVAWKADQETWARLHEEAFRTFGGAVSYAVLDNLKQGVIKPDLYEPQINPLYAALLAHYGVVADPCRVRDPNRKGTVESAIQHTQSTALKGRKFESIDAQNAWLAHWEDRWAAPRIHGRKKRQVLAMFLEERPHLKPLPLEGFRFFKQGVRTVDDAGLVQVEGSYYAALPAALYSEVTVRSYAQEIEILDAQGAVLRRHPKSTRKGQFVIAEQDRLFNPTRETARLLGRLARIGPNAEAFSHHLFARLGRPGQHALYALSNLTRHYPCEQIEAACARVLTLSEPTYQAVKRALQRTTQHGDLNAAAHSLQQCGPDIRDIAEYQAFFDHHADGKQPSGT
jgi:transposase